MGLYFNHTILFFSINYFIVQIIIIKIQKLFTIYTVNTLLTNIICGILTLLIFLRSPDDIQFRRQMSPISSLLGNSAPNVVKNRFDIFILSLVLILITIQIASSYFSR